MRLRKCHFKYHLTHYCWSDEVKELQTSNQSNNWR